MTEIAPMQVSQGRGGKKKSVLFQDLGGRLAPIWKKLRETLCHKRFRGKEFEQAVWTISGGPREHVAFAAGVNEKETRRRKGILGRRRRVTTANGISQPELRKKVKTRKKWDTAEADLRGDALFNGSEDRVD